MMRILCGILVSSLSMSSMVRAQEPAVTDLPALFTVSNLKANDILNIRAKPSPKSKDLGDLQLGQSVEVVRLGVDGKWARIIWGDQDAWVHRNYLTPVDMARLPNSGLPAALSCGGTEPFWGLKLEDNQLTYSDPEMSKQVEPLMWERPSANHTLRHGIASASWRGLVQKKLCSDGMSDITFGLSIDLISTDAQSNMVLSGCCSILK